MQKKESITCVILSSDYSFGDLLGIISDSLGIRSDSVGILAILQAFLAFLAWTYHLDSHWNALDFYWLSLFLSSNKYVFANAKNYLYIAQKNSRF